MLAKFPRFVAFFCVMALAVAARAEDSYYRVRLGDLKITEGELPKKPENTWRQWQKGPVMRPYAALDGPGEVYVAMGDSPSSSPFSPSVREREDVDAVYVRTAKEGDVTGRLYYPKSDWSGMAVLKFTIPAKEAKAESREPFYHAKEDYFNLLQWRNLPGGAWFRHEARQTKLALNKQADELSPTLGPPPTGARSRDGRIEEEFALFTGGRAVSENLQLDRAMRGTKPEELTVDTDTIEGITVAEIDWKPLVKDLSPKLDPLASLIPADQHVVFFPSFSAAVLTADQAELQGTPILHLAEPRSEDAMTAKRYQRQLCLSLTGLGRLMGPKVVSSVALTGSDPYYRTGTDVAVVFGANDPPLLEKLLLTQISVAAANEPQAKVEQGEIDGIKYHGVQSPDRAVCSYVAQLDGAVVVTNSLYQLERLAGVANKKSASIASLPEYTFFRNRYKLGDPDETALMFLSDATIRRWCGPRWRIATSRQVRDLAVMTELQAANMERLVKKTAQPGPIYSDFATTNVGDLRLDAQGVHSSVQGSLGFMTPIAELPMKKVSKAESEAYRWWRQGYQQNWSWAFDPIALRISLKEERLSADLTVMPLIAATQYREFLSISQDAKFGPNAGDPHNALVHFILAINPKSPMFNQAENMMSTMSQGVTLGWLGSSMALFIDDDPVWQEIAKIPGDKLYQEMPKYLDRLPVAFRAEVSNGFRLAAFLTSVRAFVEQTTPGLTHWESLKYKDQPYVKITPTERAKGEDKELEKVAVYYSASGKALLVTLSEDLMKRAIDRQLAGETKDQDRKSTQPAAQPWLGSNVGLRVDRKALDIVGVFSRDDRQMAMQMLSWGNLPILNQWKRLYPDLDPVAVHEQVWKVRLVCPGGGKYVWNDKYQTMESTVYGHPGEPKTGPADAPLLSEFSSGSFGLTFENQGLRAQVSLEKEKKK